MNLREKLHQIYETVDHIEKEGTNKAQNYKYIKSADVTHAIRKQLTALKVYAEINFEFVGAPYTISRAKDKDAPFSAVNVRCSIMFYDLESEETKTSSGLGTGADTGDKAAYKAQTGALKYALKNAFLVPDEGDPESYEEVDERPGRQYAEEPPDFQEARHAAPKAQENKQRPTPPSAVALTETFGKPLFEQDGVTNVDGKIATASTPTEKKSSSGVTAPADVPFETESVPDAAREPGDDTDDLPPTEEQLSVFRAKFRKLGDDLSTYGKLNSSKSLPINRKMVVFLLDVTKATAPKNLTKGQWDNFFLRADKIQAREGGLVDLAKLVNLANGIEGKK